MKTDILLSSDFICFTTKEYAISNNQSLPSASRTLNRLSKKGSLTRVTKGIWANIKHPYFTPLALVPLLLGREQGYISFLTTLHRCGAISQIPRDIQVATTGHSRKLSTPVATFEFFQLKPQMMLEGVEWSDTKLPYRTASAEKAFIDLLYLATRRGRRFSVLPEVEYKFNKKRINYLLTKQVRDSKIRTAILKRVFFYKV